LGSAKPAIKASAVIIISGAMVASLALPASAAKGITQIKATAPTAVAAPSAAQAPLATRSFGNIGFTGINKPKPKPQSSPVVRERTVPAVRKRTVATVSRSTTRKPVSNPAPAVPAPVPELKASSGGVLGIAASLAGIYYVYGGTTTAGFDCSGYTQYVFNKVGKNLPRTAEQQRQAVTAVSNPQPGDLVFFGAPAYHLGIYAGNGKLWDSPKTGAKVSLRSIWTSSGVTYGRV
jgi:cell wall-associated NlpC family hydrolase